VTLNSGGDKAGEVEMAHQILAYLHANPDAQDTLEGIIEWWLLDQNIKRQSERVKQALAQLIERGLIVARMGTDSRVHYGIDRSKRDEIDSLLKHWPQAG
jgi:plasmid stabilization system protein ParE